MQPEKENYIKLNGKRVQPAKQPQRYKGTCFLCKKRKMLIKEFGKGKDVCIKCNKNAEKLLNLIEMKVAAE